MALESEIIIVSGLPRTGTSLMMQMLASGGIPVLTDELRGADTDNPRGYYEFEPVKKLKDDSSWLPTARGKAVKLVTKLLYDLPPSERYRIVFMQRDLSEMLESQTKMLQRLNRPTAPHDQLASAFAAHLQRLFEWFPKQAQMRVTVINYNELAVDPEPQARRVAQFLDHRPDVSAMCAAIDPQLYRNRSATGPSG